MYYPRSYVNLRGDYIGGRVCSACGVRTWEPTRDVRRAYTEMYEHLPYSGRIGRPGVEDEVLRPRCLNMPPAMDLG